MSGTLKIYEVTRVFINVLLYKTKRGMYTVCYGYVSLFVIGFVYVLQVLILTGWVRVYTYTVTLCFILKNVL